jgi:hypothetical protein
VTCFGLANGTVSLTLVIEEHTAIPFDAIPVVTGANSAQFFNSLTPTTHTLVVTDEITGCTSTVTVTISEPAAALILREQQRILIVPPIWQPLRLWLLVER